jgi:hypothetical protein
LLCGACHVGAARVQGPVRAPSARPPRVQHQCACAHQHQAEYGSLELSASRRALLGVGVAGLAAVSGQCSSAEAAADAFEIPKEQQCFECTGSGIVNCALTDWIWTRHLCAHDRHVSRSICGVPVAPARRGVRMSVGVLVMSGCMGRQNAQQSRRQDSTWEEGQAGRGGGGGGGGCCADRVPHTRACS